MLNQVLVSFGSDERTDRVIAAVQHDGTCWMGGTSWHGRRSMRISVSNWSTTEADVDLSVEAIRRLLAAALAAWCRRRRGATGAARRLRRGDRAGSAIALAALGAAYEQLDEHNADRLEAELFGPVQRAYGRAKSTHAQFADRDGLRGPRSRDTLAGPSVDRREGLH